MELTNEEIFLAQEPLQKLLSERLPVKTSYSLSKMASKLKTQFEIIEKVRDGLVRTYGESDTKNPSQLVVRPESDGFVKFTEELDELFSQKVELVIDKVTLPQEVDGKTINIEPNVLMALDKFVEV